MNKIYFSFFLIIILMASCAPPKDNKPLINQEQNLSDGWNGGLRNGEKHGQWIRTENSIIREMGFYNQGKRQGSWIKFDADGKIERIFQNVEYEPGEKKTVTNHKSSTSNPSEAPLFEDFEPGGVFASGFYDGDYCYSGDGMVILFNANSDPFRIEFYDADSLINFWDLDSLSNRKQD